MSARRRWGVAVFGAEKVTLEVKKGISDTRSQRDGSKKETSLHRKETSMATTTADILMFAVSTVYVV